MSGRRIFINRNVIIAAFACQSDFDGDVFINLYMIVAVAGFDDDIVFVLAGESLLFAVDLDRNIAGFRVLRYADLIVFRAGLNNRLVPRVGTGRCFG